MPDQTLAEKVDYLFAVEAIKQLKARYCRFCDSGYDPDGIATLFVEDGVWDGGALFGRHAGRDAIRTQFATASDRVRFAAHLVLNPVIQVAGDTAKGRWWLLMPCTVAARDGTLEGRWLVAEYEDDYVCRDGAWMFQNLKIHAKYFSPHLEDWANHMLVDSCGS